MAILDHDRVTTPENNGIPENQSINQPVTEKTTEPTGPLVVIQGPLSTVYTEALNSVLKKEGFESQVMDTPRIVESLDDEDTEPEKSNIHYVYVTDQEHLDQTGVEEVYDGINVALGDKRLKSVSICLESIKRVSNKLAIFEGYLESRKIRTLHNRDAMLEMIIRIK